MIIHTVRPGETVYSIASLYGVSPERIILTNELNPPYALAVGQTLVILFYNQTYTVREGDTLASIAASFGTTTRILLRNNPNLNGVPLIYPGQTIVISYSQDKEGSMQINGYTYPFINRETFRKTLPYLSYLTVFTYGFTPEGELIIPDDTELVNIAKTYDVAPIMLISTLGEDGLFNNNLSSILFANPQAQNNLIANILNNMRTKGYRGLDIDFEYIYPEEKDAYVAFVQKVASTLRAEGFLTIVSLAPKTSVDQPGLLYEAHDYRRLGEAADAVLLMTYEWGYKYSKPLAISPINNVRAVLDFAVTQIPPSKIFMGIPNYGYDWPLPFVAGETEAKTISNTEAVEIAVRYGAEIQFSEESQAPFFFYSDENGIRHEVWFEDARSIRSKLALVPEYGILGASYWNILNFFPQNWAVLNLLYDIDPAL